jgi:hypothetical protein
LADKRQPSHALFSLAFELVTNRISRKFQATSENVEFCEGTFQTQYYLLAPEEKLRRKGRTSCTSTWKIAQPENAYFFNAQKSVQPAHLWYWQKTLWFQDWDECVHKRPFVNQASLCNVV